MNLSGHFQAFGKIL